jgi:hypothetical protein
MTAAFAICAAATELGLICASAIRVNPWAWELFWIAFSVFMLALAWIESHA